MGDDIRNEYYKKFMEQFNGSPDVSDEEYTVEPDLDINDYVPAETVEETLDIVYKNDINVLNILTCHYRLVHNIQKNIMMFDGLENVDDITATNKMMEFVFGEIFRFSQSDIKDKNTLYEPDADIDVDSYKELYCLMMNGEPKFICPFVVPLAFHLSTLDWLELDWEIIDLQAT